VQVFLFSILDACIAHCCFTGFIVSQPTHQRSHTLCNILNWPLSSSLLGPDISLRIFLVCSVCSSLEVIQTHEIFTLWQWYYNKTQHTNNTPHSNKTQHTKLHKQ
jgi:hypothetical protein